MSKRKIPRNTYFRRIVYFKRNERFREITKELRHKKEEVGHILKCGNILSPN